MKKRVLFVAIVPQGHTFHACGHKWEGDDEPVPGHSSIDSAIFSYSPSCYYACFITDNSTTTLYLEPQWQQVWRFILKWQKKQLILTAQQFLFLTLQNNMTWPDLVSEWRVHLECFFPKKVRFIHISLLCHLVGAGELCTRHDLGPPILKQLTYLQSLCSFSVNFGPKSQRL